MKIITNCSLLVLILLFTAFTSKAQTKALTSTTKSESTVELKTYVIEREIPNAGKLTAEQLKSIAQTSCKALKEMGPKIQWVNSYVTGNKIYCVYKAENEELIREHARRGGFPVNSISEVASIISPATAD